MNSLQIEERTYALFQGGLHCAEAACRAILESENDQDAAGTARAASAFGAGVGRSKEELCGALSGSLIALGILRGRRSAQESWDSVAAMASEFRERFQAAHGCTRCGELLAGLGPQENMEGCSRMTARAAGMMRELLDSDGLESSPRSCACCSAGS
jgi:C_GCAxxG_C_C family probable redox protein